MKMVEIECSIEELIYILETFNGEFFVTVTF